MKRRIEVWIEDPADVDLYGFGAVTCGYRFEDDDGEGRTGGAMLGGHGHEGRLAREQLVEQIVQLLEND